jgi:hypothetical protein
MRSNRFHLPGLLSPILNRRRALLGTLSLLALPAATHVSAAPPAKPKQQRPNVWPQASQVPGGVARLSLGPSAKRPVAFSGDVPLLVLGDAIEWTALVGIPLAATPGDASIVVRSESGAEKQVAYTVAPKQYREQRLTVPPRTVDLSPEDEARYERERAHLATVMATFTDLRPDASLQMRVPVPAAAPVRSVCAACSTASRAIRTAAWTSRPAPARRCWRRCRGG